MKFGRDGIDYDLRVCLGTLAIAATGGALAAFLELPLPWLIGSQLALAVVALLGLPIFGAAPQWPRASRDIFLPVLGVMVGASFSAEVLGEIHRWWPSVVILSGYLVAMHGLVYLICRRIGGQDPATAFFAAFPGGFVEATLMGEKAGADHRLILVQHFLRIFLIVLVVPLVFAWFFGHSVGSAAGAAQARGHLLPLPQMTVLLLAGGAGTLVAHRLRFPAPDISGAIFASAALYLSGLVEGRMPDVLVAVTQLLIGTALGVGFAGIRRRDILRAIGVAALGFGLVFAVSLAAARVVAPLTGTEPAAVILAFMPGGLAEMSLIAISLHIATPFVVLHHLYRILFTVAVLPHLRRLTT